jgi:O-antigen/teichoic acid export membrane protein
VLWFSAWLGVQFLLPLIAIGFAFPAAWIELVWRGEHRSLVLLAFMAAYMQGTLWQVIMQAGESQRITKWVQGASMVTVLIHLIVVALAWWWEWLGISLILILTAIEWAVASWVIVRQLKFSTFPIEQDNFKNVFNEFWRYCLPLIPYTWFGFVYEFADRWLLQTYGGSVQQAFYAVAFQFSAVVAIATSSILNIFWKEIAEAHHQGNNERVELLYRKVSRGLFFIAACGAGFFIPWSGEILLITLGPAYVSGATALAIMFLYPLHQSMGQIGGTMLYATGRIRAQVIIGMMFTSMSIVVTYFILAPSDEAIPGLGLGSMGLASKMVVMQLIFINITAIYLARSLKIKFDWTFQPISILGCLTAGWLASLLSKWLLNMPSHLMVEILLSGFIYLVMLGVMVWMMPSIAGLSRLEILASVSRIPQMRQKK